MSKKFSKTLLLTALSLIADFLSNPMTIYHSALYRDLESQTKEHWKTYSAHILLKRHAFVLLSKKPVQRQLGARGFKLYVLIVALALPQHCSFQLTASAGLKDVIQYTYIFCSPPEIYRIYYALHQHHMLTFSSLDYIPSSL